MTILRGRPEWPYDSRLAQLRKLHHLNSGVAHTMSFFIFGRFRAQTGNEAALEAAITEVAEPTRAEPGCIDFGAYRSRKDSRLFYIHSEWIDEAAFDSHAELPHTVRFIEIAQRLIDHPLDVTRADRIL